MLTRGMLGGGILGWLLAIMAMVAILQSIPVNFGLWAFLISMVGGSIGFVIGYVVGGKSNG